MRGFKEYQSALALWGIELRQIQSPSGKPAYQAIYQGRVLCKYATLPAIREWVIRRLTQRDATY